MVELAPHAANLILLGPDHTVDLPLRTPPSAQARLEKGQPFEDASLPDRLLVAESASSDAIQVVLDERCAAGEDPATALRRVTLRGGEVTGGILAAEDITNRAGLERRLAVSERLAAVGRLAARVELHQTHPRVVLGWPHQK